MFDEAQPPVAIIDYPSEITTSSQATFSAKKSTDPNNDIISYEWNIEDSYYDTQIVTHVFSIPGKHTITLSVTDDDGLSSSDERLIFVKDTGPFIITVEPPTFNEEFDDSEVVIPQISKSGDSKAPIAKITGPSITQTNTPITLSAVDSIDSDGVITKYHWNFGNWNEGSGIRSSVTYDKADRYVVTLTVTDNEGREGVAQHYVHVKPSDEPVIVTSNEPKLSFIIGGERGSNFGEFDDPKGVVVDSNQNIYVLDAGNHRIQKFDSNGVFMKSWGGQGLGDSQFVNPMDIAIDSSNNIYVLETGKKYDDGGNRIQKFSSDGKFLKSWGSKGANNSEFEFPLGFSINDKNIMVVMDTKNNRIQKFGSDGNFMKGWMKSSGSADGEFSNASDVVSDSNGQMYVADTGNHRIQKFDYDGRFIKSWGGEGRGPGQFIKPSALFLEKGFLYVADTGNHRIQKFDSEGNFILNIGPDSICKYGCSGLGEFDDPTGIFVDASGMIYVADMDNDRIQIFNP